MNHLISNQRKSIIFTVVTTLVFLLVAQSLTLAQGTPRKFKTGDQIEMGRGVTYKIIECRLKPNTGEEECDFIAFFEDGTRSNVNTVLAFNLRRDEQLAKAEKKRLEVVNGSANTNNQPEPRPGASNQEDETPIETPSNDAVLTVTAQQLYTEYNNNDTAARKKYVGKMVRVTGVVVYTISETKFSARFSKTYTGSTIQCHLEDIDQIESLNKGETVTIVGKPLGSMTSTGVIFEPCRIERKTSNQTPTPTIKTPIKTTGKTARNVGNLVGTWYYTAIINAGNAQELSNSESYLWLKDDGSYENRFGGVGQIGTYTSGGNRLTLNRENVGPKTYTMTITGKTMTLKSGTGGYKLERE